jgi:DNA helicase-4
LVRQLLLLWKKDWESTDYLGDVLPRIMGDLEEACSQERKVLRQIQEIVSPEEWAGLPQTARNERFLLEIAWKVQPELETDIRKFQLKRAHTKFLEYRDALNEEWYFERRRDQIAKRRRTIRYDIVRYDIAEARDLFEKSKEVLMTSEQKALDTWFTVEVKKSVDSFVDERVVPLLEKYEFEQARTEFSCIGEFAESSILDALIARYAAEQQAEHEAAQIGELLEKQEFLKAQEAYERAASVSAGQFARMMGPHVEKFQDSCGFPVDSYKARAISTVARRTLVEARAGSGKTTLLACFVRLLVDKMGVNPDQILIMAFNKSAADSIGDKIKSAHGVESFSNARTFHSLAWHITPGIEKTKVLSDDSDGETWADSRRKFLEEIWKDLRRRRPRLWLLALLMFRKEMTRREADLDPDSEEYYLYRRNECHSSLHGETVKSKGEKYIADFLLEHDVHYSYERTYFWDRKIYRPDFSLFDNGRLVVLEHWGIDPEDPTSQAPPNWQKTTAQYRAEIERKRAFWRQKDVKLLETNAEQVWHMGREGFEAKLKTLLETEGFRCKRLSDKEIARKVSDSRTRKLVDLFGQCITRAKKAGLSPRDVRRAYRENCANEPKVRAFGNLAWRVYEAYENRMRQESITDYDTLLASAAQRVEAASGKVLVEDKTRGHFKLEHLRWLLIDEYQDFSRLFDDLVESIARHNPNIRVLCVGDNWQAINGFAGSELRFIDRFEEQHADSHPLRFSLPINRRSGQKIVEVGNRLMGGIKGELARVLGKNPIGNVRVVHVDDAFVDLRAVDASSEQEHPDHIYIVAHESYGKTRTDLLGSKYLKLVCGLVGADSSRSYSILTRTNWLSSMKITEFESRLLECLGEEFLAEMARNRKSIDISTVHKYKGRESDVSIVLRATDRQFPLIHPDSALFSPLGETTTRVIAEERRLFYVAVSRAREELILVTERGYESAFLEDALGRTF